MTYAIQMTNPDSEKSLYSRFTPGRGTHVVTFNSREDAQAKIDGAAHRNSDFGYTFRVVEVRTCRNCGETFPVATRGQDCCSSVCRSQLSVWTR